VAAEERDGGIAQGVDQAERKPMIEGLIAGTLVGMADTRQGKNGTSYALAKVKAVAADGDSFIVNVIAFSTEAGA
jgi:hypothetical protein